jgi:2-methylcitrate dehydratase PrpD
VESITQRLVDFAMKTNYDDLPKAVIHESKRVLLDSLGCAVAGLSSEKGKFAVKLATQLGGPTESSIFGTGCKVACSNAAFANGELINSQDYDADAQGHFSPALIPGPLALAEKVGATGKDLILAVALGHEITMRMRSGLPTIAETVIKGPDKGKNFLAPVYGYGFAVIGGTAACGKILKLDRENMFNSLGVAGYISPVACGGKYREPHPAVMTKYTAQGWTCQTQVTAALLGGMGYRGDHTVLDGDYGYWRFFAPSEKWDLNLVIDRLGEEWHVQTLVYKFYPCCTISHTCMDGLSYLMEKHNLKAEDIEHITLYINQGIQDPNRANNINYTKEIVNQIDAQFSIFYPVAALVNGVKKTDWQDLDTIRNTKITEFMKKISIEDYPDWDKIHMAHPGSIPNAVEVTAGGKKFKEDRLYRKGYGGVVRKPANAAPYLDNIRATDEELSQKFIENTSRVLPWAKTNEAVERILNLEQMGNIGELSKLITL